MYPHDQEVGATAIRCKKPELGKQGIRTGYVQAGEVCRYPILLWAIDVAAKEVVLLDPARDEYELLVLETIQNMP